MEAFAGGTDCDSVALDSMPSSCKTSTEVGINNIYYNFSTVSTHKKSSAFDCYWSKSNLNSGKKIFKNVN